MGRILVLGAGGMLGNAIFRFFLEDAHHTTTGTLRSVARLNQFSPTERQALLTGIDVTAADALIPVFADAAPDVVINCIGIIKQHEAAHDHLATLAINAAFPHRLAQLCQLAKARLIHISTDCVFSGDKGNYREEDFPDAHDLYGRTKYLGEVDYPHAITLRTSIIGHELGSAHSLVDWFLSQEGTVKGYENAIFSGLPTVEIARVIRDHVLPDPSLHGVYHLSASPISKYALLSLVAETYGKNIEIVPDGAVAINRSLDSTRFREKTGYCPPTWPELVAGMHRASWPFHHPQTRKTS